MKKHHQKQHWEINRWIYLMR